MADYKNLKKFCYFSYLSDEALEAISRRLHTIEFPAGAEIIREDRPANAFYLIKEGEVEVYKRTKWGQQARLSVIGHAGSFGEMALLTSSPRCCSVIAKSSVKLLALLKSDFEEIVRLDSAFSVFAKKRARSYSHYNQMKTLQPFALLEPERMAGILEKMRERSYAKGENIVMQGDKGDMYYIIKSGSVAVMKKMFDDEPQKVATLYEGQGFGEEALITGAPRSATVQAEEDTAVWTLSHNDFNQVMKVSFLDEITADDVLKKNRQNYLDVRMQMEYDEERIPDAVHIPLDELRQRYAELDPAREYYVYCLLGARSAIASFLLNSHGLKAKSIKGGLMNWPGPVEGAAAGVHTAFTPT
jgi:CRP-like cAMP-binding protein